MHWKYANARSSGFLKSHLMAASEYKVINSERKGLDLCILRFELAINPKSLLAISPRPRRWLGFDVETSASLFHTPRKYRKQTGQEIIPAGYLTFATITTLQSPIANLVAVLWLNHWHKTHECTENLETLHGHSLTRFVHYRVPVVTSCWCGRGSSILYFITSSVLKHGHIYTSPQ